MLIATTLEIGKMMGNSERDINQYGLKASVPVSKESLKGSILTVAKMMGNSEEELTRYGADNSEMGRVETDTEKIKRLLSV